MTTYDKRIIHDTGLSRGVSSSPRTGIRLEKPLAQNGRRQRVRLFDPADLRRVSAYRPLPLNWKGNKGLLFRLFVMSSPYDYYLKPDEVADFLEINTSDLQSLRARGIGPGFTKDAGGSIRYNIGKLLEYVAEHRRSGTSQE